MEELDSQLREFGLESFFDWYLRRRFAPEQPWLILGKGPSFSRRDQFDLSAYATVSINHAVREQPVTVAHIIDLDVIDACADALERNAEVVVMPWYPHVKNGPGQRDLETLSRDNPTLARLREEGRLLWYNLSSAPDFLDDSPVVRVKFFSAEAVLNLLATAGVRRIRSLGIDGGSEYSESFDDLDDKTLLANRWKTFDLQFSEIAQTLLTTGIDYAPLHVPAPIRVFVASTEKELLPVRLLEFSIRKRTSMSVSVLPLFRAEIDIPIPKDRRNLPRTPFSFQRFLIPELTGYEGRAIYLDADMQVFADLSRLWLQPLDDTEILAVGDTQNGARRPQFSVMLLNCDLLRWDIREIVAALDRGELNYERLMWEMAVADRIRADLDPNWNSLERYDQQTTRLLHYTDMPTQPWIHADNPLGHLWLRDLLEAVALGHIPLSFIEEEVEKGHVRPSLVPQVREGIDEGLLLPKIVRDLDRAFDAPYHAVAGRRRFARVMDFGMARAYVRSLYHRGPWSRWMAGLRRRLTQRR